MESPILMLVFGIAVGVLLTAKPVKELVASIDEKAPTALPYVVFGFLLFTATWALQWLGFIVVITTFGLYQVFGSSDLGQKIRAFFKFDWAKRKKKEVEVPPTIQPPASPVEQTIPVDDGPDDVQIDDSPPEEKPGDE